MGPMHMEMMPPPAMAGMDAANDGSDATGAAMGGMGPMHMEDDATSSDGRYGCSQ